MKNIDYDQIVTPEQTYLEFAKSVINDVAKRIDTPDMVLSKEIYLLKNALTVLEEMRLHRYNPELVANNPESALRKLEQNGMPYSRVNEPDFDDWAWQVTYEFE